MYVFIFFFFKYTAAPRDPPSSPTAPSPAPPPPRPPPSPPPRPRRSCTLDVSSRPPSRYLIVGRPPGRERTSRRSEEHTSELQSRQYLVCRLLLEKKKHN